MASARPSSTRFSVGLDLQEVDELLDDRPVGHLGGLGPSAEDEGRRDRVGQVVVPAEREVVGDAEVVEQLDVLEHPGDAEPGDLVRRQAHELASVQLDRPLLWAVYPGDAVEDGGLAGSVGPDDGEELVHVDVERDVAQRLRATEAQSQRLRLQHGSLGVGRLLPAGQDAAQRRCGAHQLSHLLRRR
jgi:hypothetical protein